MLRNSAMPHLGWPKLMRAETAALYVDEKNAAAFLRRVGKIYPIGRKISGRGLVWAKEDLDCAIKQIVSQRGGGCSAADDL